MGRLAPRRTPSRYKKFKKEDYQVPAKEAVDPAAKERMNQQFAGAVGAKPQMLERLERTTRALEEKHDDMVRERLKRAEEEKR